MRTMTNKESGTDKMDFEGQRAGEQLLFVFRRNIVAMRKGFYALLIFFAVSLSLSFIWGYNTNLFILPVIIMGLGLILFFYHFVRWYFTVYIVTDQRLRQITQRGIFSKEVFDLKLSKIQNISYNVPGILGELFKYGTIVIQTIVGDLVIHNVAHPSKIYNKLQDAVNDAAEEHIDDEEIS